LRQRVSIQVLGSIGYIGGELSKLSSLRNPKELCYGLAIETMERINEAVYDNDTAAWRV
jgi:hypothetical protein